MKRRMLRMALPALLCLGAFGCSTPVGQYFAKRGADLGDCVWAEAGLGWPVAPFLFPKTKGQVMEGPGGAPAPSRSPWRSLLVPKLYVRVKATDFAVVGDGYAQPVSFGWRGRYRAPGSTVALAAGCPLYRNLEETEGTSADTHWLVLTTRAYSGTPPGPGGKLAERFWTGVSATLLLSARLDFNLVELADFLVGWTGYDLLGDDDWPRNLKEGVAK